MSRDAPAFDSVSNQLGTAGILRRKDWHTASHRFAYHQSESVCERRKHEQINLLHHLEQFNAWFCTEVFKARGVLVDVIAREIHRACQQQARILQRELLPGGYQMGNSF